MWFLNRPTGETAAYFLKISNIIKNKCSDVEEKEQKKMENIAKILKLNVNQLTNCKQQSITKTCRNIIKTIFPNQAVLVKKKYHHYQSKNYVQFIVSLIVYAYIYIYIYIYKRNAQIFSCWLYLYEKNSRIFFPFLFPQMS